MKFKKLMVYVIIITVLHYTEYFKKIKQIINEIYK